MEFHDNKLNTSNDSLRPDRNRAHIVEVDQKHLLAITEKICQNGNCRYPLIALRLMIYCIANMDSNGRIPISARHLAKSMNVHYDTVTKCLKYLRINEILRIER